MEPPVALLDPLALTLVTIGGAAGGVARHRLAAAIGRLCGEALPWGTLAVNLSGSLAIGAIAGATDAHTSFFWLLAVVGFLGGYTTVSSLALQAAGMTQARRAAIYLAASVGGGIVLTAGGYWLGSML